LLDSRFRVPGTKVRFGIDPLIGLVPVAGDFIGLLIGFYIVIALASLELSAWTRFRMVFNVVADFLVGSVPVVGDVLDVFFRSNRKNIALAKRALKKRGKL